MVVVFVMKLRVKFKKSGVLVYVGHLDLMRYFQRAVKRAEIPIKFSEGFNPHQIMSFSAPLSVGVTSDGEYMDIETTRDVDLEETARRLQENMVEGLEIVHVVEMDEHAKNSMAVVTAAQYEVSVKVAVCEAQPSVVLSDVAEKLADFYGQPEINIIKTTKKGERELNLKPLVYELSVENISGCDVFKMLVSSGSVDNIKPELVLNAFYDFCGIKMPDNAYDIKRNDMFMGEYPDLQALG